MEGLLIWWTNHSDSLCLWEQTCNRIKYKDRATKLQEFNIDFLKACGFRNAWTIILILDWYTDILAATVEK